MQVDSFDYEETIVKKMEDNKPKELSNRLSFRFGDCTNLKDVYEDGKFNVAVDKGTLDAIAVDVRDETIEKCETYFDEMVRILNSTGTLIIVSLLQPHVLKIILDFFILDNKRNTF